MKQFNCIKYIYIITCKIWIAVICYNSCWKYMWLSLRHTQHRLSTIHGAKMAGHIKALISIKGTYSYWTILETPIHSDGSPKKQDIYSSLNQTHPPRRSKLLCLTCYFESTQRVKKVLVFDEAIVERLVDVENEEENKVKTNSNTDTVNKNDRYI